MGRPVEFSPGMFCWVELLTSDAKSAKHFYSTLFGWEYDDRPISQGGTYSMVKHRGNDLAGLYEMDAQQSGPPPHWGSYVLVESADAAAQKAKTLGGTICMDPFDVMDAGRMAMIQDPGGAFFGVWQAKRHKGAGAADNTPGTWCWNELRTRDAKQALAFYSGLFGWTSHAQPSDPYIDLQHRGRPAGGIIPIQESWGPVPPHWAVYFAVDDCDNAVRRARELGAQVRMGCTDIPGIGRFAELADPQQAGFAVIKLDRPDAPAT